MFAIAIERVAWAAGRPAAPAGLRRGGRIPIDTTFPVYHHLRRRGGASLVIATALLSVALPSLAAAELTVMVTINRFIQGQDPDPVQVVDAIDEPDTIGFGDYYARVRIGDEPFERNRADFRESRDFRPFWKFSRDVDTTGTIPVIIQMWDADPIENNDDIIDLNGTDDVQDLALSLDLSTCSWTGDAVTTASGDGDHEHFGAAEGGELGHIAFDITCSDGDFDDDGIADGEERLGVFDFVNGAWAQMIDLPSLGSNPCRKTILVEVDWVTGAEPRAAGFAVARDAFDAASIPAPDGPCPYSDFGASQGGVQLITDVDNSGLPTTFADAVPTVQLCNQDGAGDA